MRRFLRKHFHKRHLRDQREKVEKRRKEEKSIRDGNHLTLRSHVRKICCNKNDSLEGKVKNLSLSSLVVGTESPGKKCNKSFALRETSARDRKKFVCMSSPGDDRANYVVSRI